MSGAQAAARVAVILVNHNDGRHLFRALDSLEAQTRAPARVIVVDNGSTDGSREVLQERFPQVQVIELGHNAGFAAANNAGVRAAADCEYVALLNADAFPEPGWIEALVRAARAHPDDGLFASRMLTDDDPRLLDGTGDVFHVSGLVWRRDHLRPVGEPEPDEEGGEVFSACAASALYRRDLYEQLGGLDEDYFIYYCDTDLAFRFRLAGYGCRYVPDAVVRHVGSAHTGRASDFTLYHTHRNLVWTFLKDMPWPLLALYLPQHLLLNLVSLALFSKRGHARAVLAAKRDALAALPAVMRKRRAVQRGRRAGTLELLAVMERGTSVAVRGGARREVRAP